MRAFLCVPVEPEIAASIDHIARDLRDAARTRASWVSRGNLHVTLRFLGEIDPLLTIDLQKAVRSAVRRLGPFKLTLDRLGGFPSIERARILWIGGEASPAFHGLASSLQHELRKLGFSSDRRPTVAHVTLARIKGRPDPELPRLIDRLQSFAPLTIHADRIVLMESVLTSGGAIYTPLFTTRLRRSDDDGG
jgi:2'-5' RNA ligase